MKDNDLILSLIRKIKREFDDSFYRWVVCSTKQVTTESIAAIIKDVTENFFIEEFNKKMEYLKKAFKEKYVPPMIENFKEKSMQFINKN